MAFIEEVANASVKHVDIVSSGNARGLVQNIYLQMKKEFRIVPPMSVHSKVPHILAAVWSMSREALVVGPNRIEKELIATAVSEINDCPFCVDVHTVMLKAGGLSIESSLRKSDEFSKIENWAKSTLDPNNEILRNPPFKEEFRASYFGTAIAFHYMNRVVNIFMKEGSPLNMAGGSGWTRGLLKSIAARSIGKSILRKTGVPGMSLQFLPVQSALCEIPWIKNGGTVGHALALFFEILSKEGESVFSDLNSKNEIERIVNLWCGEPAPISKAWIKEAIANIDRSDRASATLALLVARCSHQVSDTDIADFRSIHSTDEELIKIVAYGASLGAKRIATWIDPGYEAEGD